MRFFDVCEREKQNDEMLRMVEKRVALYGDLSERQEKTRNMYWTLHF